MSPTRTRVRSYDPVAVDRVRRTLEAVARATEAEEPAPPPPPDSDTLPRLGSASDPGRVAGRAGWWLGAGVVGAAAAALVGLMVLNRPDGAPPPTIAAAGVGQPATLNAGAAGTSVAVPGIVPEGFEFENFRVLDPLAGGIEVAVYRDGDALVAAFETEEAETADRLAERTALWGDRLELSRPVHDAGVGYLAVARDAGSGTPEPDDALEPLIDGEDPAVAAPEGFRLAALKRTAGLPEAGRLVAVAYEDGLRSLRLETRQGTLEPDLAAHLYPSAKALAVRGRPGFEAEAAEEDGTLLIWQEAPGLVVSVTATDLDRATLDRFVGGITLVPEETWVALREPVVTLESADEEVDVPPRPVVEGEAAGVDYAVEAFERGSLADGVARCRRLRVDLPAGGPIDETGCDAPAVSGRAGGMVVASLVVPPEVVLVRPDVTAAAPPELVADPALPGVVAHVILLLPAGQDASVQLVDAGGTVIETRTIAA
jgi:hypothetical protein